MSDYISREAVNQIIAAQCGECADACLEFDGIQPDCNQCLLYGAKKAIESIPAADVRPRWIPVTERMPVSGVPVLICGDGNVVEQGFFDDEYGYWYDCRGIRTFVHHWKPMLQWSKEES